METKFCQSCGMPLQKNEELGTNHDGSKNEEYCCYCYKERGLHDGLYDGSDDRLIVPSLSMSSIKMRTFIIRKRRP